MKWDQQTTNTFNCKRAFMFKRIIFLGAVLWLAVTTVKAGVPNTDSVRVWQLIEKGVDTMAVDTAIGYRFFDEAFLLARKVHSDYLQGDVLLQRGVQYYGHGQYERAIKLMQQAAPYFAKGSYSLKEARCYANMGLLFEQVGDYTSALRSFYKGFSIATDKPGNEDVMIGLCTNTSITYLGLGDMRSALSFALKGVDYEIKLKDTARLSGAYNIIAEIYTDLEKLDSAIYYYKASIHLAKQLGAEEDENSVLSNLANVYLKLDDIDSALYYKAQTVQFATEHKSERFSNYCYTITTYGYMLAAAGKTVQAGKYLAGCLSCKPLIKDYGFALNYYSFLYQYYKSTGKTALALDNMESLKEVNDSLHAASSNFENQRIAARYEFETKAREDSLNYQLKISHQEIVAATYKSRMYLLLVALLLIAGAALMVIQRVRKKQQQKRRAALEAMRTSIASDLHDDIGSTLSSIQIVSSLAIVESTDNPQLHKWVSQISELSGKVSDGIREIVWSINPAHDKLGAIIELMRKIAADVLGPSEILFRLEQRIKNPDQILTPRQRKDLLMIYKEALNNARKYSETRQVDITVQQEGGLLNLEITDYGKGFDLEAVLKGSGLDNMKRRALDMKATWEIQSQIGIGTKIRLSLYLV